jgi:hypothetical protein
MKISNKEINIKVGEKEYKISNYIDGYYLNKCADGSFGNTPVTYDYKVLEICKIEFDTSGTYDIELTSNFLSTTEQNKEITSTNKITTNYNYFYNGDWADHIGKQITKLGFFTEDTVNVMAYVDVTNSNIIVQAGQYISINRVDEITTEAIFYSPFANITYPSHLSVINGTFDGINPLRKYVAILDSIGFGFVYNEIHLEFLYADIPVIYTGNEGEYDFTFIGEAVGDTFYPSDSIYPSATLYPEAPSYQYIIYKHKLLEYVGSAYVDSGYYYYQSVPYEVNSLINLKAKIERG